MSKHTPGPWILAPQLNRVLSPDDGSDYEIASCTGMDSGHPAPKDEQRANARLITAAPELLEALKRLCEESYGSDTDNPKMWIQAENAITKAEES